MILKHPFTKKLKSARDIRNLTVSQVASRAKLSVSAIIKYEKGEREPSISNAIRLAKAYEMNLTDIFLPDLVTNK